MTYTVSQINNYIKNNFTRDYILNHIIVEGEISNLKESRGNYYFNLKDENSYISCIMFSNFINDSLDSILNGIQVNVTGSIRVYEKNGTYSIYATKVEKRGIGEYYLKLEELKKKLLERGMFDSMYKKDIPRYSKNIGVVTALNGAAIKDIEKTIRDKNPYAKIYLYPSKVQGEDAYKSIIIGINKLDELNLDCIIVGRGGGSTEDLNAYNNEELAYAIFNAKTPIISAVGHEINDSICDLVSDVRVATPTAAGEKSTFSYYDFIEDLNEYNENLENLIRFKIDNINDLINEYNLKINVFSPKAKVENLKSKYTIYKNKLNQIIYNKLNLIKYLYDNKIKELKLYNVFDKLEKGYSYVTNNKNDKISSIKNIKVGDKINLLFKDGKIESIVKAIKKGDLL